MAICVICGKEFTPSRYSKGLCCSGACGGEYTRRIQTKPKRRAICQECGKEFEVGRECKGMYCSVQCQGKGEGRRRHEEAVIRANQKAFIEAANRLVARKKAEKEKERQDFIKAARNIRTCQECGRTYYSAKRKLYCSKACAEKKTNRLKLDRERFAGDETADYSITRLKLFRRDRGKCQLCGKRLEFIADYNAEDYPTIDHIVPVSKGGRHTWDNVQLACRRCNSAKRDYILETNEEGKPIFIL